ncbi:MAG: hypothetical protein ISS48_02505 [Candidatus Aenigmarchaeota archaeon]|nr:hypothetical protein [Candidatus Aenigmarchaeota archaeon]
MVRYVSPIICSLGTLLECNPDCPAGKFYPLGDTVEEAKRKALSLMHHPPQLGSCVFGGEIFLEGYPDGDSGLMYRHPRIFDMDTGDEIT